MAVSSTSPRAFNPGFHHHKTEVQELTCAKAEKHRDMQKSPTERELSQRRMNFLTYKIENGLFMPPNWAIAIRPDGSEVRMNGQTTSTVIARMNGTFPDGMKVVVSYFKVDGPEGEANLFRQIDARQSGRSPADVAGAYQGQQAELREADRKTVKLAVEAYVWFHRRVARQGVPRGDDRYELIGVRAEVRQFALWLDNIMTSQNKMLRREPVVAAMYSSWVANADQATNFWQEVARGSYDEDSKVPAHVLSNWLLAEYDEPSASTDELYQGAVFGWNQHRAGNQIASIKYGIRRDGRFNDTAE